MRPMRNMFRGLVYLTLHTILCMVWGVHPGDAGGRRSPGERDCPKACFCNKLSKIVYCSRRGLSYIPDNIPRDALQLNLNSNTFLTPVIQRSNFSRFHDMEHLYLSECGIETIEVDTFRDLANLKWLDLSNNRVRIIHDYTFRGLALLHLFLNGNRDLELHSGSFGGLVTGGLYLHDCSLKGIELSVVAPLNNTLGYLWLNGNELETVSKGFASVFESLSHLRLGSNPLHCNCELLWLKEFYDRHGDVFEGGVAPSCLTPARLRGRFFSELTESELRCTAPVFGNIDARFDPGRSRLKCTASGDPAPTLYWIQPSGRTSRYLSPLVNGGARRTEGVLEVEAGDPGTGGADRSGMYICVANNDAGNVTLTVNVTWPRGCAATRAGGGGGSSPYKTLTVTSIVRGGPPSPAPTSGTADPKRRRTSDSSVGSSTPRPRPVTSQRDQQRRSGYETNYTAICKMLDFSIRSRAGRLFNLTELIGAVIGTHICTLLVCLVLMPIYYRWKNRQQQGHSLEKKKAPPSEKLFLNGMGHRTVDYMETPTTSPKH
ncbi:hypothetical protein LSH36_274g04021 [Paralvinella palmiformis]|uniref:Ig-like domain-containing protein n=1 Tax=Paralvinella palmiformis TaxID=53620 RepID=A0AAD9JKM6_9ANNE|nr:hypothetical protein LSH36_274g04021 [Paralvinella palmiformis]